jgi:Kef-type K+ transport system membrane component KefB
MDMEHDLFKTFFLIFTGSAISASLALYLRQPLLVIYMVIGAILGPFGIHWIKHVEVVTELSHIGILFLLFLLGLEMKPSKLLAVLKEATWVWVLSSAIFFVLGFCVGIVMNFSSNESIVLGMASMFSSTIIGIKLLPTTVLHHKHVGELMIGILLLQDVLAILCLIILLSGNIANFEVLSLGKTFLGLLILAGTGYAFFRFVLVYLLEKFSSFSEYLFLMSIGWCMGLAYWAECLGLSHEIGASLAGVFMASNVISHYITINLKPLRDFFLILFFVSTGARFNLALLQDVWIGALAISILVIALKPVVYRFLLSRHSERPSLAWDVGFRLGQLSEFSLLICYTALAGGMISDEMSVLIQSSVMLTFLVSSYIVIFNYPNPIATNDKLRRD